MAEKDIRGPGATVVGLGAGEGDNPFSPVAARQPFDNLGFQDRITGGRDPSAVDNQDALFTRPERLLEKIFEGLLGLRRAQPMKIQMGLYGKITPVQLFCILRGDAAACPFHIFGRLGDYKPLAIFYQLLQPLPGIIFRFIDRVTCRRDRRFSSFMIFIPGQRFDACHGFPKGAFFVICYGKPR